MNKSFAYLAIAAFGLLTACSKKETVTPTNLTTLSAAIDGSQQVPANSSTASGIFTGTYDSNIKVLTYTVTYRGITPTAAHIHTGAPGMSGPITISFSGLTSPITGTFYLSLDEINDLLNNRMYVNVHSSTYGNGEIRGNIHK